MNENKNIPLATEIIRTLKKIIFALIILEFLTIAGFMWYLSLPADDTITTQTIEDITDGDIHQVGGDFNGESNTDDTESQESSKSKTEQYKEKKNKEVMKIPNFTKPELEYIIDQANFTDREKELLWLRNNEHSLEECAEIMDYSIATIKRLNKNIKSKILRVL